MRPRHKKNLVKRLERCSSINIDNPSELRGKWESVFGNYHSLHLEIGCGKGAFVTGMAEKYPDVNFIAMELFSNVIVIAIERIFSAGLPNVRFICGNAVNLADYFAENELDKIYLNFSDPWTKKGHAKRRLTHPEFLKVYKNLLVPGGEIEQKTDDRLLFDYSLQSFKECGFSIEKLSYNLHSGDASDNILSEYEQKFIESGLPICKVLVKNQK